MDAESRPDLLSRGVRPAFTAAVRLARAAAVVLVAGCGGKASPPPPDLPAVGRQSSLLRFPRAGGPVQAYVPDSLRPAGWQTLTPVPPLRQVVGVDLDERIAFALDTAGNLVGIDLEARGVRRSLLPGISTAAMGPDGSLFLARTDRKIVRLVRRSPVELTQQLAAIPRAMYGTVSGHLVAVTATAPRRLLLAGGESTLREEQLPEGQIAATYWGDLIAVAADTAVVLIETLGEPVFRSTRIGEGVRDVAFSPSGHRLYVSRNSRDVVVLDRYGFGALPSIRLPGIPRA
ncbi:MAG TPA: hypothetical protein VFN96_07310, partial [Gemmatimonadales bacterium]|nr:hypothetical protein [Gemmatimonadales bacterium]